MCWQLLRSFTCTTAPTTPNIVGLTMLWLYIASVCMGLKILTGFKLYATSANIVVVPCKRTQHVVYINVGTFTVTFYNQNMSKPSQYLYQIKYNKIKFRCLLERPALPQLKFPAPGHFLMSNSRPPGKVFCQVSGGCWSFELIDT